MKTDANVGSRIPPEVRSQFSHGNATRALCGSESIFPRVRQLIASAHKQVEVEMMDVSDPTMVDLLTTRAKAGVRVDVLLQRPDGSAYTQPRQDAIKHLRSAGVHVHQSRKNAPLDHVKLLLVDGQVAVLGGMNWGVHSAQNHDFCVEVEGPAVSELEALFADHFGRRAVAAHTLAAGHDEVNVLMTDRGNRAHAMARNTVRAIDTATRAIHAEMYVLTDDRILDALIAARARGVDVRIILDPLMIGDKSINLKAAERLRANGIDVRWYRCNQDTAEKMHAKLALFDDGQVIIGSANWTAAGGYQNREADVEVLSRTLHRDFEKRFEEDWKRHTVARPIYRQASP